MQNVLKKIAGEGLQSTILKNVFWVFLGTTLSKGLLFISFIIVTYLLSKDDYGKLNIVRSTITTFSLFSIASLGITATKYIAIHLSTDIKRTERILSMTRILVFTLSLIVSFFIFIFSNQISEFILKDNSLKYAVQLSSIAIFFTSMNSLQNGILAGLEEFKYITIISISNGIYSFFLLLIATYYYGLYGGIVAICGVQVLLWFESIFYVNKAMKKHGLGNKWKFYKSENSILRDFTLPSFVSGIIVPPVLYLCDLFIINIPNGYLHLASYKAALNFSVITLTLIAVLGQVLYPIVMRNSNSQKLEFVNQIIPFAIGIILNLPLILFPDIFAHIFDSKYHNKEMYVSIVFVSLTTIIISHRQGISRKFASLNYMWWSSLGNSVWAIIAIFAVNHFAHRGGEGIAIGLFIAYFLNTLFFIPFYINKKLIDKVNLINKYSIIIWSSLLLASILVFIDLTLVFRIIFSLFILLLNVICLFKWIYSNLGYANY